MSFNQHELEFWLPSDFLTDDDNDMDTKFRTSDSTSSRFLLPQPIDGCGGGGGSALSSPGKSVVGSTETESDEDAFLLSELTHRLSLLDRHKATPTRPVEKNYVHSGSPQSTLLHVESFSGLSNGSSNGSPNGPSQVSSPPTTPLASNNNSSWDVISKAAGLVECLKTHNSGVLTPSINPPATVFQRQGPFSTLPPPKSASVYPKYGIRAEPVRNGPNNLYSGQKFDVSAENGGGLSPFVYCGYPNVQVGPAGGRGCGFQLGGGYGGGVGHGYGYGSGNRVVRVGDVVKNERVGTGVFLPRRFDEKNRGNTHFCSNAVDTRKKSGNLGANSVKKVPIMMKNSNNQSSSTQCQPKIFGCNTTAGYDALLARKVSVPVSVPTLQRKTVPFHESPIRHEICLPQEWTY